MAAVVTASRRRTTVDNALYLQRPPTVAAESSRVATIVLNIGQSSHHQVSQPTLQAQIPRSCAGLGHPATTKSVGLP